MTAIKIYVIEFFFSSFYPRDRMKRARRDDRDGVEEGRERERERLVVTPRGLEYTRVSRCMGHQSGNDSLTARNGLHGPGLHFLLVPPNDSDA